MRILHVVNIYFTIPYFIGDQFLYFKNKGYNLNVICSPSPYLKDYSENMGFSYKEVEIARSFTIFKDLKAIIIICNYIKVNHIDIVVGHTPKGALLSMISSYIMRVPKRIYFRHGLVYETSKGFKRNLLIFLDKLTAFFSTQIICVSASVFKRSLEDKLNNKDKQIILGKGTCTGIDVFKIFNPARINKELLEALRIKLGISADTIVIGYCGRLVCDKGINELVQAFDLVKKNNSLLKLCLLLVGMFEERDSLPMETIDKIKKDKDIICTGFVNKSIEYYYALMNIYVLASFREGFPTSVLEASAMEIPVLTTRVTGCIDSIVEDVTGRFIDNNSNSITKEIEFYLKNPFIAKNNGHNGREFVKKYYNQELIWSEIEKLYE